MKLFNNISGVVAVAIAASVAVSCTKLDEYNPSGTTAQAIWSTPAGFLDVVNGSYNYIHDMYGVEDGLYLQETGTDLWINPQAQATYAYQITEYQGYTSTQSTTKGAWTNLWAGINLCNSGIGAIDNAGFTDTTDKGHRLGELRFLRALYYFHVVENWGGVMLRTAPTNGAELTATRSSVEAIYDVMIGDLLYAKDHLPIKWSSSTTADYMRATKKAAGGLLARAYLTRAYYSTGADAQAWFTKARDAALDVINNQSTLNCSLYATPGDLWNPSNNKNNKEALFVINYDVTNTAYNVGTTNGNRLYKWFQTKYNGRPGLITSIPYGNDGDPRLQPTWHLLDVFDATKDARYDASFQEVWIANGSAYSYSKADTGASSGTYQKDPTMLGKTINVGDTAMYITKGSLDNKSTRKYIAYDASQTYVNPVSGQGAKINTAPLLTPYYVNFKKFADYTRPLASTSGGYNDVIVMRLAEMYMIAAEADFQLGDLTNAALNINVLRTRAAKTGQAAAMQIAPSDVTLQFILDERAREFCGELQRWYDLKRVFRGDDFPAYIMKWNPDITTVQTYHRLRPIPQAELDALLNSSEFGQNPGY